MKTYEEMAEKILSCAGGAENIENSNHCATRLRLTVCDAAAVDQKGMKAVKGVMGLVVRNNDFQVVVGTDVPNVYAAFVRLLESGAGTPAKNESSSAQDEGRSEQNKGRSEQNKERSEQNEGRSEQNKERSVRGGNGTAGKAEQKAAGKDAKHYFGKFVDFIGGIFVPILPVLIAGGLIGAILTVCTSFFGLGTESGTYQVLSAVNNAAFYFLPVYVGYNVAKKLNIPAILGAYLGAVLLHSAINGVEGLSFLGAPVAAVAYGSSVLPIIFGVLFMSVIYKFFDKIMPKEIKYFAVPLLTMLIVTPVTLVALGPVGTWCGNALAAGLQWVNLKLGWLSVGLMGAISPLLYMTGMNQALFPLCFAEFDAFGYDPFVLPGMLAANVSVGAAALTVWFRSKKPDNKAIALSTGITGVLGITEPAVFGVLLPLKRPLIASMIGGCVGGIFAGLVHLAEYAVVAPGLAGLIAFIPADGTMTNFYLAIVTVIISIVATVIATLALGFREKMD